MADPLFWLALSFLLVVVSLTAVLMVAIPAMRELGRAARSAEKMFDTLSRELPPTLEAIRLTGLEITELTDDVTEGVQSAGQVVQQVNQSLVTAKTGAQRLNTGTRSVLAGARAAWRAWAGETPEPPPPRRREPAPRPAIASPNRPPDRPESEAPPLTHLNGEPSPDDYALPDAHAVPRLEETSLRPAPETRPEAAPDSLPRAEAAPRRSPQDFSRPTNRD
ncbi:DUF948 domain-containing protein [Leptolyngbya sp. KIOST-1]|uniref:DUF948 domain-containing protein n=1 Tax=Leptolyngbya sp. KIOST-1 TaxID=1229172 RepID=UPI0009077A43|nr:DUF948 domain-containing protein [Leptolyngbya sp. KIOST-1]